MRTSEGVDSSGKLVYLRLNSCAVEYNTNHPNYAYWSRLTPDTLFSWSPSLLQAVAKLLEDEVLDCLELPENPPYGLAFDEALTANDGFLRGWRAAREYLENHGHKFTDSSLDD